MLAILIAETKEGKILSLVDQISRQDLREMRKNTKFYCPQCKEQVLLKVGEVKIPHFAHQTAVSCRFLFSEGETALHLAGKQQLYHFLRKVNGLTVQLEPYFRHLKQRPDLLVSTKNEKIPIEFQCSRITTADIRRRTKGYKDAKMSPIWILQTPTKLKQLPLGITSYSLSRFEEQFLQSISTNNHFILTYDAYTQTFHYLSALLHLCGRKFIVNHRTLSMSHQIFPFAKPKLLTIKELETYHSLYMKERLTFLRQRIFFNRKGVNDPFLRECYELRLIPSELPEWIGVPMTMHYWEGEHACEWQLSLLHFIRKKNMKIDEVTKDDLFEFAYTTKRLKEHDMATFELYLSFLLEVGITSISTKVSHVKYNEMRAISLQYLQSEMRIEKI